MTGERRYLSIGEVLGLLLEEFPDVTISKIRFLESQGLIEPERTPSGYRKFYDDDVERLRVILREQRTNFLPLKVIRDRLETGEIPRDFDPTPTGTIRLPRSSGRSTLGPGSFPPIPPTHPSARTPAAASRGGTGGPQAVTPPDSPNDAREAPAPMTPVRPTPAAATTSSALGSSVVHSETSEPAPLSPPALTVVQGTAGIPTRPAPEPAHSLTLDDLCAESGVDEAFLDALEDHGIVVSGRIGGVRSFDAESVRAVRAAAVLRSHGLEPRHLRVWKQMAERELALVEQLVLPLLRQRNPLSRDEAARLAETVDEAGNDLRAALVERALRILLG